jgi:hypothetical protein
MTTTITPAGPAAPSTIILDSNDDPQQRSRAIAELNDQCRAGTLRQAKTVFTRGCIDRFCDPDDPLSLFAVQSALLAKVRAHDCSPDEDPHGERDFGVFEHEGQKLYWKIDYYDPSLSFGSDDPSDVTQTMRVLTILLASEY